MKVEALKHIAATVSANIRPTDKEVAAALAEGAEVLLGFFANVERIANSLDGSNNDGVATQLREIDRSLNSR